MDSVGLPVGVEPERVQLEPMSPREATWDLDSQTTLAKLKAAEHRVSEVEAGFANYRRSTQKDLTATRAELASLQDQMARKLIELELAEALGSELDLAKVEIGQLRAERTELLDELDSRKGGISSARQMLLEAKRQGQEERVTAKEHLSTISLKLSDAETHLVATQAELSHSRTELSAAKSELLSCRSQLMSTRTDLSTSSGTVQAQEALINQLQATVAELRTELEQFREGDGGSRLQVADLERQLSEARRHFSVAHLEASKQKARADGLQREVEELRQNGSRNLQTDTEAVKDAKCLVCRDGSSPAYRERTPPPYVPRLPTLTSPNMLCRV